MPPDSVLWQWVESTARNVFGVYGYREIRTPIVEHTDLFRRGIGETSAVVEKEMYTFIDQGEKSLTLRPEGTASVVRAYIESGAHVAEPVARYYYMGPMFRRERPQKGRQRQFYQIGCELLGVSSPQSDAEVIAMVAHFFSDLGLQGIDLELNSIGCKACSPRYNKDLVDFLKDHEDVLCDDCRRRMTKNPMRTFDCKGESCRALMKAAPTMVDYWCDECRAHFDDVRRSLDLLEVKYEVNPKIVRGLDYYMRTAFEFTSGGLGAQNTVVGGGRYDGLVSDLGGPEVAGIGFALGMERLVILLKEQQDRKPVEDVVFFAVIGDNARDAVLPIMQTIRRDGVRVEWDYAAKSLKAQMRRAGRINAETVVIIGDDEIAKGVAIVKDMRKGSQQEVRIRDLPMHFVQIGG